MTAVLVIIAFAFLLLQLNVEVTGRRLAKRSVTEEALEACAREITLTSEEEQKYLNEDNFTEDDKVINSLVGCISNKTGAIDSKGDVNYDKIVNLIVRITKDKNGHTLSDRLFEHALHRAADKCQASARQLATPEQTATRALYCVRNEGNAITNNYIKMTMEPDSCIRDSKVSKSFSNYYKDSSEVVLLSCLAKILELVDSNNVINYEGIKDLIVFHSNPERSENHVLSLLFKLALHEATEWCKKNNIQKATKEQILLDTFNCIFNKMRSFVAD